MHRFPAQLPTSDLTPDEVRQRDADRVVAEAYEARGGVVCICGHPDHAHVWRRRCVGAQGECPCTFCVERGHSLMEGGFYMLSSDFADYIAKYRPYGLFTSGWITNDIEASATPTPYPYGPRWRAIARARGYSCAEIRNAAEWRRRHDRGENPPWPPLRTLRLIAKMKAGSDFGIGLAPKPAPVPLYVTPPSEKYDAALPSASPTAVDLGDPSRDASDGLHVLSDAPSGYGSFVITAKVEGPPRIFINGHPQEVYDAGICVIEGCGKPFGEDVIGGLPYCDEHAKGLYG